MDDFKKILNEIYKLFENEYKTPIIKDNEYISFFNCSSFFKYLKSI